MKNNTLNKTVITLSVGGLVTLSANASTLVTNNLFDVVTKVRKPGSTEALVVAIADTTPHTVISSGISGATNWSKTVTGFTQSRVGTPEVTVNTPLGPVTTPAETLADAQLAAYISMDGTSLTFGREITTDIVKIQSSLDEAINAIAAVSPLQTWSSTATVGANIVAGTTYQVTVDITTGSGLPADLISSAQIGVVGVGIQDTHNSAFTKLNLVDLIVLGDDLTGTATFEFIPTEEMNSIGFEFSAEAVADVSAFGGVAGNQDLLTFNNLIVAPVPEPSTSLLGITAACLLMGTRRRVSNRR